VPRAKQPTFPPATTMPLFAGALGTLPLLLLTLLVLLLAAVDARRRPAARKTVPLKSSAQLDPHFPQSALPSHSHPHPHETPRLMAQSPRLLEPGRRGGGATVLPGLAASPTDSD
jgi:hypothetical protein